MGPTWAPHLPHPRRGKFGKTARGERRDAQHSQKVRPMFGSCRFIFLKSFW